MIGKTQNFTRIPNLATRAPEIAIQGKMLKKIKKKEENLEFEKLETFKK